MRLVLHAYEAEGYQERYLGDPEGDHMPVRFLEAEVESDDGSLRYTLGRLWWTPDFWARLGDTVTVEGEGVKIVDGQLKTALTVIG